MTNAYTRLDQALRDLIEAYTEIEEELESKHADDEDSFAHAMIEALEGAIESSIEERDVTTNAMAAILSNLTEALEQLDPAAFDEDSSDEDEDEEEEEEDEDLEDSDIDYDIDEDSEVEDIDDDEEEEEEEEGEEYEEEEDDDD